MGVQVLVLGDSLTFHGPEHELPPSDPRLWPQQMAAQIASQRGEPVSVDLYARVGWTARDAWWALTKDPTCWGESLPNADAVVIATGGMDQLPAALPTYLREGIAYVRPGPLRRVLREGYRRAAPGLMRITGGRMRQLPQAATDTYHRRIVQAVRTWQPQMPIVLMGPSPFDSRYHPVNSGHPAAVRAARAWSEHMHCPLVEVDPLVWPSLTDGRANPDGLHWSWESHQLVGSAMACALLPQLP